MAHQLIQVIYLMHVHVQAILFILSLRLIFYKVLVKSAYQFLCLYLLLLDSNLTPSSWILLYTIGLSGSEIRESWICSSSIWGWCTASIPVQSRSRKGWNCCSDYRGQWSCGIWLPSCKTFHKPLIWCRWRLTLRLTSFQSLVIELAGVLFVLICTGCKQIVFKMDHYGNGEEIVLENVFNPGSCTPSFQNFDQELFTG